MMFRPHTRARRRHPSAFTLLETLLSLAMVVTLLFVMTTVFDDLVDARQRIQRGALVVEGATSALELLARAADTVVATDGAGEAGVVGDATSLQITRSGVATSRLSRGDTEVSPLFDKHAIELAFRGAALEVRDGDGGVWSTLVPNIFAIRFQYHDGTAWSDSWNSGATGLPVAIECAIWTTPWPEGLRPDWMPEFDQDGEDELDAESGGARSDDAFAADFGSEAGDLFSGSPTLLTTGDPMPRPDHVRVVAILDAVPVSESRGEGEGQR